MIEIKIDKEDIERAINKVRKISLKEQDSITYKALVDATAFVEQKLKLNVSGKILKVRSGRLRSSIGSIVIQRNNEPVGIIGSGVRQGKRVPYADIHETGGIITPKRVRWLTIPLRAALTPAGVPRGRARDFADTFFAWSGGNLFLFQKQGQNVIPLFILKKSVNIPARRYMSRTAEEAMPAIAEIMIRRIVKEVNQ